MCAPALPWQDAAECCLCHDAVPEESAVVVDGRTYCPTCDAILTDSVEGSRRANLREVFRPALCLTPTPADVAHDAATEARAYTPDRTNFHE